MSLVTLVALTLPFWETPRVVPRTTNIIPQAIHRNVKGSDANAWTKPGKWCGWYMRKLKGVGNPKYNRAIAWAKYGSNAGGPAPGVIVVWRNHVGILTGERDAHGRWYVHSGNDSNRVRTRARSLKGVIAYRI